MFETKEEKTERLIRSKEKTNAIIRGLYRRDPVVVAPNRCGCRICKNNRRRASRRQTW